MFNREVVDPNI